MKRFSLACLAILIGVVAATGQTSVPAPMNCTEVAAQAARAQATLKDWPALGRYHESNVTLAAPAKSESRVVFMGDSITDNWDNANYGPFFPGKPYVNRGISGQTTPQMLIRFRADVIALRPKVVVILAGTNDIAGNTGPTTLEAIEDNLASMAELAQSNGIRVVFSSVLPISDYEIREGKQIIRSVQRPPDQIKALNQWMQNYVARNKLVYLDYYSAMIDSKGFLKDELSEDGLHPNRKGYVIMEPLAEQAIAVALRKKK